MTRLNDRSPDELRPTIITPGFTIHAEGSVLIEMGETKVICTASIEDRVLIGMAAVLLNGVQVGHDSIVAAGTLLTEGTRIPPRSLVMGRPGKVRRELTDEEVAEIRWNADNYVRYRLDYQS